MGFARRGCLAVWSGVTGARSTHWGGERAGGGLREARADGWCGLWEPRLRVGRTPVALLLAVLALAIPATLAPAAMAADAFDAALAHDFTFAAARLDAAARTIGSSSYPTTTSSTGSWTTASASDWRSGFFAGALWLMYERTGDPAWKTRAEARTSGLRGLMVYDLEDMAVARARFDQLA